MVAVAVEQRPGSFGQNEVGGCMQWQCTSENAKPKYRNFEADVSSEISYAYQQFLLNGFPTTFEFVSWETRYVLDFSRKQQVNQSTQHVRRIRWVANGANSGGGVVASALREESAVEPYRKRCRTMPVKSKAAACPQRPCPLAPSFYGHIVEQRVLPSGARLTVRAHSKEPRVSSYRDCEGAEPVNSSYNLSYV